jgi:hypothetical protein
MALSDNLSEAPCFPQDLTVSCSVNVYCIDLRSSQANVHKAESRESITPLGKVFTGRSAFEIASKVLSGCPAALPAYVYYSHYNH